MGDKNYITAYCHVKNGEININGGVDFVDKSTILSTDFLKNVYKNYQLAYPKFYKMDSLCKLSFIASELLIKIRKITENYLKEDIAIVIANSASSLEVDTEYQMSIANKENYFPSPSVFVYTLPNILIGEIAIRHQIKGENTFFIFEKFNTSFMNCYVNNLLQSSFAKCCLTGWVDFFEDKYEAFLYLVEAEKSGLGIVHNNENLDRLMG